MMQDRVDINYIECELLKKYIAVLHENHGFEEDSIICSKSMNHMDVQLRCELTEYFPYEFPQIYILDSCRSIKY